MLKRLAILVCLVLLPVQSWAAITYVGVTNSESEVISVASKTTPVTVSAGTDPALIACVTTRGSADGAAVTSITRGAQTFTLARAQVQGTGPTFRASLYVLPNATVGTADVVVNFANANNNQVLGYSVVQANGVNTTSPIDSVSGSGSTTGTTSSSIITTIADGALIVDCDLVRSFVGLTVGAGQTQRVNRTLSTTIPGNIWNGGAGVSTVAKATAGSETMDWTQTNSFDWVHAAMSLTPSGGSEPEPTEPSQVTLTWTNGTDPGSPSSGVQSTTIRRCTGVGCNAQTAPAITTRAFPLTSYIDNTVAPNTTYGYSAFHTDGVARVSTNHASVYVTTSATPPDDPPSIIGLVLDATGADLTYGAVVPTQIEVNIFSNTRGTISSVIHEISDFPAGRFTNEWLPGQDGVCFIPIDEAGLKNNTSTDYRCGSLTSIVGQLDTTPPTLSSCQPTIDLPAGTTQWDISCVLDKPGAVKYDTTDTTYDLMANDMAVNSLTASATVSDLTNGSTTTLYLRPAVQDIFDDIHAATSSTVVTVTVAASTADTTPPGDVANAVGTVLGNAVLLSWDTATDAVSYQVYQSLDDVTFFPAGSPTGLTNTQLFLAFNTTYYFKIKALDVVNNLSTNFSNTVEKTTTLAPDNIPPSDLEGLQVEVFTNSIRASWMTGTDNAGPVAVNLEYCLAEVGQLDCVNFNVTVSQIGQSFLTLNLLPGRTYCFRGKNADSAGNVSVNYSATVCEETATAGVGRPRADLRFGVTRPAPTETFAPSVERPTRP